MTALGAVLLLALGLLPAPPEPAAPEERAGRGREEAFRILDKYLATRLQEALSLSDEEHARVLPLVMQLQVHRRQLAHRRIRALGEMRRLLREGRATGPRIEELLRELKAVEAEEPEVLRRDREALDAALTPVQQAQFRVMEAEVERRLRQVMAGVRQRGPGPGRRRASPPH